MKKKIFLAVLAGALLTQNIFAFAQETEQGTMLAQGVNRLASNIYQELDVQDNVFFSPYSLSIALSMLDLEADGQTKEQIEEMLGIEDLDEWSREVSDYINGGDKEDAKLETANAMWISKQLELSQNAEEEVFTPLKEFFGSEIFQADMENEDKKVLSDINEWVSDHTEGMIDPLLEELPGGTVSVLVNAVYFDGKWTNPFDEEQTQKETFYGTKEESEVDMMAQSGEFRYVETDEYQAVQIPYGDGSIAMNILLPADDEGKPVEEWYEALGKGQDEIWKELNEAQMTEMESVKLPKFSLEYSIPDLDRIMKALGMTEAYSDQADFSRLAEGLKVDSIVHKAKLEVSEEYTKAAAATGIISKMTAILEEEEKPEFVADHPFLFVIQDTQNDMILFMGQVNQL